MLSENEDRKQIADVARRRFFEKAGLGKGDLKTL